MVAELRYSNFLKMKWSLFNIFKWKLKTHSFECEIDRTSMGTYYYAHHMNAILGVYTTLDEFNDLQCDYVEQLVEIILFIVDSGCSKHITGNFKLLSNFMEQFLGTVKFGNDQFALILGYGDMVQGNGNDLLTGSHGSDLYSITLQYTFTPNLIFLMAKATSSQAWLWHHRLSHLNFDTINMLLKYDIVTGLPKLKFGNIIFVLLVSWGKKNVKSFNGKKYVLVIVNDYSRYTWTHFLRSKDETPEVLINFLKLVQRGLHAQVRAIRIDKGTQFLNKTLHAYFGQEGIEHQTSTARTPKQNDIVERWNAKTVTTSNELDLLFSLMFDELLNRTTPVMSKSSAVHATYAPNQRQQQNITPSTLAAVVADTAPLNIQTTPDTTSHAPTQAPTVTAPENINQAETQKENT
ncbi:retrovirus-related pol polyprotein from transposon TNT 1-94 [Tanacetum coccineum]